MEQTATRDAALVDATTFFEVSLDLLVIRDLEGLVLKASRSWHTKLGHLPEEMEGRPLLRFVHPDDLSGTAESVVEVENRRDGDPVVGFINRYRHKDGHYRTLEWRAQRAGDRIYGVARDVTDRVAAERQLIEAKAAAEAANRAKSDFLANISHEIRTPLNGVIGIIDALSRTALTPEQAEMIGLVQDSGATLERLVSDFLDVSKIEAGQMQLENRSFNLDQALRPGVEMMRRRAEEKGLSFKVERPPVTGGRHLGDGMRLSQVIGNLLSNAIKFTDHGQITLRVAATEAEGRTYLTFEIEDTGIGFDADQAAGLFTRFSQADESISRRFGGTGLGLAICRSLVEMMGGEISATSQPGIGSRFVFSLSLQRLQDAVEVGSAPAPPEPLALPEQPLRVLLVEDHPTNQRVAQLILATQGAEVVTVDDGLAAIAAFADGRFDVVLMDMQMPRMDGLTATRAIRALETESGRPRTPVIMLSANALSRHHEQALNAGADLHVAKPITAAALLSGIQAAMT